jgi:rhodanese-related sulfurtransferase
MSDTRWVDIRPHHVLARPRHQRVIDVRDANELDGEFGYIDGMEHVPLSRLAEVARGRDRDDELIVVCRSGARSTRAAEILHAMGFRKIHNLEGGMIGWHAHGLPARRRSA